MDSLPATLWAQAGSWSLAETTAVVFAVLYLLLAIRENIWCWFFAGVSTALYVWIFITARLYMESVLNVFYFGMAIYGWHAWSAGGRASEQLPVSRWPLSIHLVALAVIALLVVPTGLWLSANTDAAFPFIDSATTFGAIWTTFLVARKVLENWWYWLVIDIVSMWVYWSRDLQLTALLFALYVLMIPFGLVSWTRSYRAMPRMARS